MAGQLFSTWTTTSDVSIFRVSACVWQITLDTYWIATYSTRSIFLLSSSSSTLKLLLWWHRTPRLLCSICLLSSTVFAIYLQLLPHIFEKLIVAFHFQRNFDTIRTLFLFFDVKAINTTFFELYSKPIWDINTHTDRERESQQEDKLTVSWKRNSFHRARAGIRRHRRQQSRRNQINQAVRLLWIDWHFASMTEPSTTTTKTTTTPMDVVKQICNKILKLK